MVYDPNHNSSNSSKTRKEKGIGQQVLDEMNKKEAERVREGSISPSTDRICISHQKKEVLVQLAN